MSKRRGKEGQLDPKDIPDELLEEMIGTMFPIMSYIPHRENGETANYRRVG